MEKINPHISLIEGNIFFSNLQTITITVNCVGVMGKGLALQAKHLVPDAYKYYQNLCKNNEMQMGIPIIYNKRTNFLKTSNDEYKMLLLFPTKQHWKMESKLIEIERGLRWLVDNYKKLGIKSLAVPALGCGNGGLDWRDVGPLMYKYFQKLDIPVEIYLPEKNIPEKYLTEEFLQKEPSKITDF